MGSATDKIKGSANEVMGKAKQTVGRVTGNSDVEADGIAQEVKGKAQKTVGNVKEAVKDAAQTVADKAKKNL